MRTKGQISVSASQWQSVISTALCQTTSEPPLNPRLRVEKYHEQSHKLTMNIDGHTLEVSLGLHSIELLRQRKRHINDIANGTLEIWDKLPTERKEDVLNGVIWREADNKK